MSDESPRPAAHCHYCGKRIKPTKTNKAQSYCDDKCRQAAYRWRMRARVNPTIADKAISQRQAQWRQSGYSDELIRALMVFWIEHGGLAIDATERILALHEEIVVERWAEKYTRDMDAAIEGAKHMERLYKEAEEKRRSGT